jgi:hypothetical protein
MTTTAKPKNRATKARTAPTKARKTKGAAASPTSADEAATAPGGATVAKRERKPTLLDAAVRVLREAGEPMGAKPMVEQILAAGWWSTQGKTPEATLYAAIVREIGSRDGKTRFQKTGRGRFALVEAAPA